MIRLQPACAAAAFALLAAAPPGDPHAVLQATAAEYLKNVVVMSHLTGRDMAFEYYQRLTDDLDLLDVPPPDGYTADVWKRGVDTNVALDLDAVRQLMHGPFRAMGDVRGAGEVFIKASSDGTMQPVALYVPSTYTPGKALPLMIFLHGHPQSETQLLSPQFVRDLAEKTGTIVVAPFARGNYNYRGTETDVYDAYDAAQHAFTIDPRKHYLAGYSMGGFSVFEVATLHPGDWTAVMCVAGSLLGSQAHAVVASLHDKPFYVLTGTNDDAIPTQYPTSTAVYLRQQGFDVSFYSQPGGLHRLVTLLPILTQAWNDMEAGIVRAPPADFAQIQLPNLTPPANAVKP